MIKQLKNFLFRGTFFAGFGPIIYGIIILTLELVNVDTMLDGIVVFKGIISTYLLAFFVSGASIIWQEEKMGLATKIAIHAMALYISYLVTYLINGWLGSNIIGVIIFSIIFISGYAVIWLVIFIVERIRVKSFNKKLN
jgi:uncharacterized membrane protein YhdT